MSLESTITTLLSRLETVTARLETVEKQLAVGGGAPTKSIPSGGDASLGADSQSVREYEDLINQFIVPFVDVSGKLGAPEVAEQAQLVLQAVNAQKDMLKIAASSKKPSQDVISKLLQPTSQIMAQIVSLRDAKRTSKFFNHLSTVSEGISALGWVVVSPTPGPHVADMRGGSEFYSNRILKDFKGKEQSHVDWVAGFNGFLKELQVFIKKNHTTGLEWNPRGGDASSAQVSSSSSGGSAPPPPPGPPPPPIVDSGNTGKPAAPDVSGLFAELNKGTDISKGLKKVTADMKSKNRTDKTSVVPAKDTPVTSTTAKSGKEPSKPPKFALEGSKWVVEFQNGNKGIVIEASEAKQSVYLFKCLNTTVQVKGKLNNITIDGCTKTAVVFESLVSGIDVVNSSGVEIQVTGKVPSIAIDKTSGCQLYLGKDALDTEIISSKSSEMNVSLPGPDGDLVEMPIPEQYKTTVKDGKLITENNSHV